MREKKKVQSAMQEDFQIKTVRWEPEAASIFALNKDCGHENEFFPNKESYESIYKLAKEVKYLESRLTISWCGRIRGRSLWFLLPADLVGYPTENLREKRGNSPSATIEEQSRSLSANDICL